MRLAQTPLRGRVLSRPHDIVGRFCETPVYGSASDTLGGIGTIGGVGTETSWCSEKNGPFEIERDTARLVVILARREPNGACTLLLEEKSDSILKTRLVSAGLTLREAEVLLWVMRGKASSEIAVILGSKTATISKHLEHIYQKLGVENRTAAANAASELIASP